MEEVAVRKIEAATEWQGACLVWTKNKTRGYGNLRIDYKLWRVTRLVMTLVLGRELSPKEYVLHSCDNPPCVNPGHLRLGDQAANMADMKARGRDRKASLKGKDSPNYKHGRYCNGDQEG